MGKLDAGKLRERVFLLTTATPVRDPNGYGFKPDGADTEQEVWARVRPLSGREKLGLGQTINAEAYEITIRSLRTATPKQRVRWKGKVLDVQAVQADESREYELLTCLYGGR